ncbi:alkaline phosphatase [Dyadobacter psychrotolerans]|uniref:Alkaline phosphatase n=1 Tax=Dyadobacter psychrotolerans TaxID=2541721 RepID=A0A4R5DMX9_9BACT|nr:alkaline phosphatase [Dyadobacter psychrotolerans]TDE15662.1 alkaline phosphatase [Dyadobacter psychrotolerans]
MRIIFQIVFFGFLASFSSWGQTPQTYTTAQAHSHNDYEQKFPFWSAYNQQFGSVEADIFLRNDSLFVAHNAKDIRPGRTLKSLYLSPLLSQINKNKGVVYSKTTDSLQLLIDLKTSGKETIAVLVRELQEFKSILAPNGPVKIVLSGNTPPPAEFEKYPSFIYFDGRPGIVYTASQLLRVGLISQSFDTFSHWNGKGVLTKDDKSAIEKVVTQTHAIGKKLRLWATPDFINSWKMFMNLGIDYLNTDKVEELGPYLRSRPASEYYEIKSYAAYKPTYRNNDSSGDVRNVILLIGDGMGLAQIYSGVTANKGELNLTKFLNIGFSKTSASDSYITDSAAGATAMATGKKTRNRAIGVDSDFKVIANLPEKLRPLGIKTGLISAGNILDATPAAFFAHQPYRDYEKLIAHDYLKSSVDILIGGGAKMFNDEKVSDSLRLKGIRYSNNWADLAGMNPPFVLLNDDKTRSVQKGRGDFLTQSFKKTYRSLENNKNGFFIMAEGAQIDYGGHANNMSYVVTEMLDFDLLVGEAMKYADSNGQTLVIVTADHETGGLTLLDGSISKGYVDGHFSTNDHTGIMVSVFAYGPHSMDFRGVYENTEIFEKIMAVLNLNRKKL